jgi:integrase
VCQVLSAAYNRAKKKRIIAWSPMEGVERPAYESASGAKEPLTAAEVGALLETAATEEDPLFALWSLSAATGCRPGELLGLHRDDVHIDDPNAAFIVLRRRLIDAHDRIPLFADDTKSGAKGNARLSIDPDTARALAAHLEHQAADRERLGERYLDYGLLFCTEGGAPLIERNVRDDFKRALKRAGVTRDMTFYGLRHAHATLILESGHDIKAVQARLRHSNLTVLNTTYAHVRQAMDADVAKSVGAAIRQRKKA